MASIADELRRLLADQAESAPPGTELLTVTKARSRRRTVRRRATVAGLAALAVAATSTALPALLRGSGPAAPQPVAAPQSAGPSISPSPTATAILFAPATVQPTVSFPYRPTYTPPGLPAANVLRTQTDFLMHMRQTDDSHWLKTEVHTTQPVVNGISGLEQSTTQAQQVRGKAGTLATAAGTPQTLYLFWPEKPGLWLSVQAVGVSRADVLRYAEGLREQPLSGTEAIRFALVPVGMRIHESLHTSMTFARPGATNLDGNEPAIGVLVNKVGQLPSTGGTQVQVGAHRGYLLPGDGGTRQVVVDLGGGSTLEVTAGGCSDTDLVRFAAGITVDLTNL